MIYQTGEALRQALEDRLRTQSNQSGVPLVRLRKMVAFERFLTRLVQDRPGAWLLKGGLALQWRLGNRARTTKDIDMLLVAPVHNLHQSLVRAALLDLGDWFRFLVQQSVSLAAEKLAGGVRFQVQGLLDGRPFETFHVDVGLGDPVVEPAEELMAPPLLDFAGIQPILISCYPITQQVAEKVHAYTCSYASVDSSRVKDLVDILLIAEAEAMSGPALLRALQATFNFCGTHALPSSLPDPPTARIVSFRKMAREVGLGHNTLASAAQAARSFLDPVLQGQVYEKWDPVEREWR